MLYVTQENRWVWNIISLRKRIVSFHLLCLFHALCWCQVTVYPIFNLDLIKFLCWEKILLLFPMILFRLRIMARFCGHYIWEYFHVSHSLHNVLGWIRTCSSLTYSCLPKHLHACHPFILFSWDTSASVTRCFAISNSESPIPVLNDTQFVFISSDAVFCLS